MRNVKALANKAVNAGCQIAALDEGKPFDLKRWRDRFGLSAYEATALLECSRMSMRKWEADPAGPPRSIALACIALSIKLEKANG